MGVFHRPMFDDSNLTVLSMNRGAIVAYAEDLVEGEYHYAVFGISGKNLQQDPAKIGVIHVSATLPSSTVIDSGTYCMCKYNNYWYGTPSRSNNRQCNHFC